MITDQFSPSWARVFRCSCLHGRSFSPRLVAPLLWPLLTSRGISSAGSPQVRTRCVPAQPPHLPPRLNRRTSLCGASSSHRVGLGRWFLFIGLPVSPSLPPPGRSPFRSWLQVVVSSCLFSCSVLLQGTFTPFATRPCWAHTRRCSEHACASRHLLPPPPFRPPCRCRAALRGR